MPCQSLQVNRYISYILCVASLLFSACTDELQPEQRFFPMLTPLTWTNLSLQWFPPSCCCCYSYEYVEYTYTVTLTTESRLSVNETVSHRGNGTVEIELMMDGYQCEEFSVEISLPGNCQPAKISGALLVGKSLLLYKSVLISLLLQTQCTPSHRV